MKHAVIVLTLLAGLLVIGCSDQPAVIGPTMSPAAGDSPIGVDPTDPWFQQGTFPVDLIVHAPSVRKNYSIYGSIDYTFKRDANTFELITGVGLKIEQVGLFETGSYSVKETATHTGFIPDADQVVVIEYHQIGGLEEGLLLRLAYDVTGIVRLASISLEPAEFPQVDL